MTPTKVLALLSKAQFRPFDAVDWEAYLGCESETPMIAFVDSYDIIIDGDEIQITEPDYSTVWNIQLSIEKI